jgi:protein-S-isoprenylcysteine O-methyltransferase Ste14
MAVQMKASTFEFRYRVWIIGAIFWLSFLLYFMDHHNATAFLLGWLSRTSRHSFNHAFGFRLAFAISALIAAGASLLRTWATAYIRATVVHDSTIHSEVLVAAGPYRHLRNPLYLGTWLLAVSMGFFASRTGFFVLTTGILVFLYRLIFREEAELSAGQSGAYRQYRSRVPRFFPSLLPRVAAGSSCARWFQAFLGESMMWVMTAGIIAYAVTLRLLWFYVLLCLSFPVSFALNSMLKRGEQKPESLLTP